MSSKFLNLLSRSFVKKTNVFSGCIVHTTSPVYRVVTLVRKASVNARNTNVADNVAGQPPPSTPNDTIELTDEDFEDEKEEADLSKKLTYDKIDGKSHIITNYMVNVKSRKKREQSKTILLEGKRLIQDALDARVKPIAIFFSRPSDIAPFNLPTTVKLYRVPYKNLKFWSEVVTTQGVVGIFETPDVSKYDMPTKLPLTVVCDNVRDPGNMGSILRTVAAVGVQQLVLLKGCVDVWDSKVLRTGAGAHFRAKILQSFSWDDVKTLVPENCKVLLADSDVLKPDIEDTLTGLYELSESGEKIPILSEAPKRITAYQKTGENTTLPLLEYTNVDYRLAESFLLVIGGETQGLSEEARNLAAERSGVRIFVPLENGVESLNSGTALGILAYEIRRQYLSNV